MDITVCAGPTASALQTLAAIHLPSPTQEAARHNGQEKILGVLLLVLSYDRSEPEFSHQ